MKKKNPIFYHFILNNHFMFLLVCIITIAMGYTRTAGASYVQSIIDMLAEGSMDRLFQYITIGFIFMFLAYFTRWLGAVICLNLTEKLALETRLKLLEHFERISFLKYEEMSIGMLQSLMRNDVNAASDLLYNLFSRILNNAFLFIFSVCYMLLVNFRAALVIVIFTLLMAFLNHKILDKIKKPQKEVRESLGNLSNIIGNAFTSIDVVKTYSARDYILGLFQNERKRYNKNSLKTTKVDAGRLTIYNFANNLSLYASLAFLGYSAIKGEMTVGEVFVFIYLLKQILIPVEVIFRWMSRIVSSNVAWERIYKILDLEIDNDEQNINITKINSLNIENINFSYDGKKNTINNRDVFLSKGELTSLKGQSGSGKSTLIKIILGLYRCKNSIFTINESENMKGIRNMVSFAPSDNQLFNLTLYENIALGNADITIEACMDLAEKLKINDWINSLPKGLDTVVTENAKNLSGGQKQMINNMRAILHDRPILIFDEPFSALDAEKEKALLNLLNERKEEKIILFTSHNGEICDSADNILML